MKHWMLALAVPLALAACRTIVGIDDLQSPPPNNRDEAGPPGGGNEGGADSGPTVCDPRFECAKCCKGAYPEVADRFANNTGKRCVCDPGLPGTCGGPEGVCGGQCLPDGGPFSGGPTACSACVEKVLGGASTCADEACAGDPRCQAGLACLRTCEQP